MRRMSKQHKIMAILLIVILGAYAYEYGLADMLGGQKSVSSLKNELHRLKMEKYNKQKAAAREKAKKDLLNANSIYFWKTTGRVPTLTIQSALNKAASSAQVKFRNTGTPRDMDVAENIKKVQMSVSLQCSMRDASRFFQEVDTMRPAFFWDNCTIRPDRREVNKVYISGTLVTYVLEKKASKLLSGDKEVKK